MFGKHNLNHGEVNHETSMQWSSVKGLWNDQERKQFCFEIEYILELCQNLSFKVTWNIHQYNWPLLNLSGILQIPRLT